MNKKKKISIKNEGQFIGNVDSPGGQVTVGDQRQLNISAAAEAAMRAHVDDPDVQRHLASDEQPETKRHKIAERLTLLAKVAADQATTFAAKLIAEYAAAHGA